MRLMAFGERCSVFVLLPSETKQCEEELEYLTSRGKRM